MARRSAPHLPAGRPLWSLHEEAHIVVDAQDERLVTVATQWAAGWAGVELRDVGPTAREVLRRMSLGPVALENVPGLGESYANWRNGVGDCSPWRRVKEMLDRLGGWVVPSLAVHDRGGPILSLAATGPDAVFVLDHLDLTAQCRAREGSTVTMVAGEAVLAGPGARYRAVLHRASARSVAEALLAGPASVDEMSVRLDLPRSLVADVVAYLGGADLLGDTTDDDRDRPNG